MKLKPRTVGGGPRVHGIVINFLPRKGYGFIRSDEGMKVFVHYSDIQGQEYRSLVTGEDVEMTIMESERGPQAIDVVRLRPPAVKDDPPPIDPKRTW